MRSFPVLVLLVLFAPLAACGGTALLPPEGDLDASPDAGLCAIVPDPNKVCAPTDLVVCPSDVVLDGCARAWDVDGGGSARAWCCTPPAPDAGR
jgi:hypothetical protein